MSFSNTFHRPIKKIIIIYRRSAWRSSKIIAGDLISFLWNITTTLIVGGNLDMCNTQCGSRPVTHKQITTNDFRAQQGNNIHLLKPSKMKKYFFLYSKIGNNYFRHSVPLSKIYYWINYLLNVWINCNGMRFVIKHSWNVYYHFTQAKISEQHQISTTHNNNTAWNIHIKWKVKSCKVSRIKNNEFQVHHKSYITSRQYENLYIYHKKILIKQNGRNILNNTT